MEEKEELRTDTVSPVQKKKRKKGSEATGSGTWWKLIKKARSFADLVPVGRLFCTGKTENSIERRRWFG